MVKKLSKTDQTALREAAKKAERRTSAEISIIVTPASDDYRDFVLFYGFILGSAIVFGLWIGAVTANLPSLLAVQLAAMLVVDAIPSLRRACIKLVPGRTRHQRAAREAMHQYHALHAHIPPATPFVLLYVSQAERYVHVVTNPVVHNKIPGNWESVTSRFTTTIRKKGIRTACSEALTNIADILAEKFPKK